MVPAAVALALLAGCGTDAAVSARPAVSGPSVPSVVGLALDQADTQLQAAGFGDAGTTDALRDRSPLVRSDWHVCTQQPGPGPAPAGTLVGVTIVQTAEACPDPATMAIPATTAPPPSPTARPDVEPTRRAHVPRRSSRPSASATPTPTSSATTEPEPAPTPPARTPTASAGTSCTTAGAVVITARGVPMVCQVGSDGRNHWKRN